MIIYGHKITKIDITLSEDYTHLSLEGSFTYGDDEIQSDLALPAC